MDDRRSGIVPTARAGQAAASGNHASTDAVMSAPSPVQVGRVLEGPFRVGHR
jgi:hypothetical protein